MEDHRMRKHNDISLPPLEEGTVEQFRRISTEIDSKSNDDLRGALGFAILTVEQREYQLRDALQALASTEAKLTEAESKLKSLEVEPWWLP